jgi:hypothetical protein
MKRSELREIICEELQFILSEGVMKYGSRAYENLKDVEDMLHYALSEAQGYRQGQEAVKIIQDTLKLVLTARRKLKDLNKLGLD